MDIVTKTPIKVQTIKEFAKEKAFTQLAPSIRVNTNGYPFITFINAKNEAENVYFSKKAAVGVSAGQVLTPELLKGYQIGYTSNEAGEERVKLISNSERVNISDLL